MRVPALPGQAAAAVVAEGRSVVDQERQRADSSRGRLDQPGGLCLDGEVGLHHPGPTAGGDDFGGEAFGVEPVVAVMDRHRIAGVGQGQGQGAADPARRPGDEGAATCASFERGLDQWNRPDSQYFGETTVLAKKSGVGRGASIGGRLFDHVCARFSRGPLARQAPTPPSVCTANC